MTAKTLPELPPLPPQRVLDRHIPTGIALHGYSAEDMRAYALQERAAEIERFAPLLRQALEVLGNHRSEHAQGRIAGVVHAIRKRLEDQAP